jgi:hypothetical protein
MIFLSGNRKEMPGGLFATSSEARRLLKALQNPRCLKKFSTSQIAYIRKGVIEKADLPYLERLADSCSRRPMNTNDDAIHTSKAVVVHPGLGKATTSLSTGNASFNLFDAVATALQFQGLDRDKTRLELAKELRMRAARFVIESSSRQRRSILKRASAKYQAQFRDSVGNSGKEFSLQTYAAKMAAGTARGSSLEAWALSETEGMTIHIYERKGNMYVRKEKYVGYQANIGNSKLFARLLRLRSGDLSYAVLMKVWEGKAVPTRRNSALRILEGTNRGDANSKIASNADALAANRASGDRSDRKNNGNNIAANLPTYVENIMSRVVL